MVIERDITEICMSRRYLFRDGLLVLLRCLVVDHIARRPIENPRALVVS